MLDNIDRKKIDWFPKIDYDKCIGCQKCFKFCRNGVYSWNKEKKQPIVVNPYNCIIGCSTCASSVCPQNAIMFPTLEQLKEMIDKAKKS